MLVNTIRVFSLTILVISVLVSLRAQDLDPKDVHVALDQALPIALAKAKRDFPDLEKLHSSFRRPESRKRGSKRPLLGVSVARESFSPFQRASGAVLYA